MASYLVYIPGVTGASPNHLSNVGLGGLLDPHASADCQDMLRHTPDQGQGVVFYWLDHQDHANDPWHLGNHPDIDWAAAKPKGELKAGRFWLGCCHGQIVTPEALLRRDNLGGAAVTLEDGNRWLVPISTVLPRTYALDENTGAPILKVANKYQQYCDLAHLNYMAMVSQDPTHDVSVTGAWDFAEMALGWNYRINADVMDWLKLVGSGTMIRILAASYDGVLIEEIEAQKKTA